MAIVLRLGAERRDALASRRLGQSHAVPRREGIAVSSSHCQTSELLLPRRHLLRSPCKASRAAQRLRLCNSGSTMNSCPRSSKLVTPKLRARSTQCVSSQPTGCWQMQSLAALSYYVRPRTTGSAIRARSYSGTISFVARVIECSGHRGLTNRIALTWRTGGWSDTLCRRPHYRGP
jgi:hypothetical protein